MSFTLLSQDGQYALLSPDGTLVLLTGGIVNFEPLIDIIKNKLADHTYSVGGHPHTFVELYGGVIINMLCTEPNVNSHRSDYYYNTVENILYYKKAVWEKVDIPIDDQDESFVYVNNKQIDKKYHTPDPKTYSNTLYYNIRHNKIYSKGIGWKNILNI